MNNRSSSFFRVDEQVFFTMAGLCAVSVLVLAFRFATRHDCAPVRIQFGNQAMVEKQPIRFKAETTEEGKFYWDFGDGSNAEENASAVNHTYENAGIYTIKVVLNGNCTDFQNIAINTKPPVHTAPVQLTILTNDTAYVNEVAKFTDSSSLSKNWKWYFGESGIVDATGSRNATHIYKTSGLKNVILEANGQTTNKPVFVIDRNEIKPQLANRPKNNEPLRPITINSKPTVDPIKAPDPVQQDQPVKKEEPKPKAPSITHSQMEDMLRNVAGGGVQLEDFSPFLCGKTGMQISYNNKVTTFDKLVAELKEMKKKKVGTITVILQKDESNCINALTITVDKKNFIDRIFH